MPKELLEHPLTTEHRTVQDMDTSLEVDHIELDPGILMFFKGEPFPLKGMPTVEALWACKVVKEATLSFVGEFGLRLILFPKSFIRAFTAIGVRALKQHFIRYEYLTPTAQALYDLLRVVLPEDTAKVIAHVIQYDQAYRFRLQDLCSATSCEKLCQQPVREINRLILLNKVSDKSAGDKVGKVGTFLMVVLMLPGMREKWRAALRSVDFSKLQFDAADAYWAQKQTDYTYLAYKV